MSDKNWITRRVKYRMPMTHKEASERHQCAECREEGNGSCEHDCVLSATMSFQCTKCNGTIYFTGSYGDIEIPVAMRCPHCHKVTLNHRLYEDLMKRSKEE